ncbi:MAG: TIGR04211 family SH3 domain-containing protein [Desulfuromonadales bacterium]|nr:TIGR04211 family SH3 domain-containing protein [Desulfuromonadales bacterium]
MKNCWRIAGPALIVLTLLATTARAETRYISDQLIVTLREKPQQNAQSITHLKTDTPVEVLEDAGDFVKVKTKAGEIGYVQTHYLLPETPKAIIIRQLQQERDRLAVKVAEMQRQLATVTSRGDKTQQELATQLAESDKQLDELREKLEESQTTLTRISQDYETLQKDAEDVVNIARERDQLRETNQELTTDVASLKDQVKDLTMSAIIKWFLAGAGVLLLGWIIGKSSGGRRRGTF